MPGAAGAPADAEIRWRVLIRDLRNHFGGRIGVELLLTDQLQMAPLFLDEVDTIYVQVRSALGANDGASVEEMAASAGALLDGKAAYWRGSASRRAGGGLPSANGGASCPNDASGVSGARGAHFGSALALSIAPRDGAGQRLPGAAGERRGAQLGERIHGVGLLPGGGAVRCLARHSRQAGRDGARVFYRRSAADNQTRRQREVTDSPLLAYIVRTPHRQVVARLPRSVHLHTDEPAAARMQGARPMCSCGRRGAALAPRPPARDGRGRPWRYWHKGRAS
jgi:hypothetical protein